MKPLQIDRSWIIKYDHYLQRCSQENRKVEQRVNVELKSQTNVAESHTTLLANMFNMIKAKRPIQNIYKRPI